MSNEEQTGTTPENWIEETAYIMREMFHAMRQSVVMTNGGMGRVITDSEEWDMSWFKRAVELRGKAELCVLNSFNYVIEHSDLLFVDDVTGDTTDDAQQTVENDEDE